jgi:hypothetical protein
MGYRGPEGLEGRRVGAGRRILEERGFLVVSVDVEEEKTSSADGAVGRTFPIAMDPIATSVAEASFKQEDEQEHDGRDGSEIVILVQLAM